MHEFVRKERCSSNRALRVGTRTEVDIVAPRDAIHAVWQVLWYDAILDISGNQIYLGNIR
jgi:hypothetical protein